MNKEQALEVVKQVCAAFNGNLQQHENIQRAIKLIEENINVKED